MIAPKTVFDIARNNAIVYHFTQSWLHGVIPWEPMLLDLVKAMRTECIRLVDTHNLSSVMSQPWFSSILDQIVISDLPEVKDPLRRQERLIELIVFSNECYRVILTLTLHKVNANSTIIAVKV